MRPSTVSKIKHVLHCALMISFVYFSEILFLKRFTSSNDIISEDQAVNQLEINSLMTAFVYCLNGFQLLILPRTIFNFLGLFLYNAFPSKVVFKGSTILAPFICFRTVTRGNFPQMVKRNVARNIKTCQKVGMENFIIEVVTQIPLDIPKQNNCRELLVPTTYRCKSGTMYKARSLQYCLEDGVNQLDNRDWIVHLDEESILTEDSVRGILNFVCDGSHHLGQGLITYANDGVVNWLTTIADSFRVAEDMGLRQCEFKMFHNPFLGVKGSFLVASVEAECNVTFDNGPDGSISEDVYFTFMAWQKGYTFDFIAGEVWEQSPFTVYDFIQQRKRWFEGMMQIVFAQQIKFRFKFFYSCWFWALLSLPFNTLLFLVAMFIPVPWNNLLKMLFIFVISMNVYASVYGVLKSVERRRISWTKYVFCILGAAFVEPFNIIIQIIAIIWGLFGEKNTFFVISKDA